MHEIPQYVTITFVCLLVAMIITLALEEKIHAKKSIITGSYAIVCLILADFWGIIPLGQITLPDNQTLSMPVYIPGIDWEVIAIILGSSLFVDVTARSGLFTWIAIKFTKASKGDPLKLLCYYGVMTVVFSAVLNNVTAMIVIGSLSVVSLEKLGQRDKLLGFLLIEGLLTNVGGLLTLISSVPNIIVGNTAGISFLDFFLTASPYVVVATVTTLYLGAKRFKISKFSTIQEKEDAFYKVNGFDENDGIESRRFFWFAGIALVSFIMVIATTSILPVAKDLGIGFVAMGFAAIMLLRYKSEVEQFYKTVDWDLLAFFMALFVVINVMEHALVLDWIGQGIKWMIGANADALGTGNLLVSAAGFSSVTDNIPLAAMLAKILASMNIETNSSLWWSVIFGSNLGGNLTPIGSASTLVAVTIMHKNGLNISFVQFIKTAFPFAIMHIVIALAYVLIFL